MAPPDPAARAGERGAAGIATVVAAALALVVFVSLANVVTTLFTRNAVRAAVDEAVRVAGRSDEPIAECEARARSVLAGLLAPAARRGVSVACTSGPEPGVVRARADVTVVPWWPAVPAWRFALEATARREVLP